MPVAAQSRWEEFRPRIASLTAEKQLTVAVFSCARSAKYYWRFCEANPCADPTVVSELLDAAWNSILDGPSNLQTSLSQLNQRLQKTAAKVRVCGRRHRPRGCNL